MEPWETKKILILGMTYPTYSMKYVENVCTGGVLQDGRMVRIHPVPLRYLDEDRRFRSWQWVRARVMPHANDGRPESLRLDPETPIELLDEIPASDPEERRKWVEKSPHMVRSVEELHERWGRDRTSLAVMRPKIVNGVRLKKRSDAERREWQEKEKALLSQESLFDRPPKPLDFPEVTFEVSWRCDDPRCNGHEMGLLTWGLHELYRRLQGDPARDEKVLDSMRNRLDLAKSDVFFFLGNFRATQWNIDLMDAFSAGKRTQLKLGF